MIAILSRIGNWLWAIAAALIGGLLLALKVLAASRSRWKEKAQVAEAGIKRQAETEAREAEIDSEWSDYENRAKEDLDTVPDILSKPRR